MPEKHEMPDDGIAHGGIGGLSGENDVAYKEDGAAELNLTQTHDQLARGLKSRHIQFLALGELQWMRAVAFDSEMAG
jgi:amino acid permease